MAKLISANELRDMAGDAKQVVVPPGAILTPSAYDLAKEMNLTLLRAGEASQVQAGEVQRSKAEDNALVAGPADVAQIVQRVLEKMNRPACLHPRLTQIKADAVVMEPFEPAPPGQTVRLKDVITAREGNLGAGFMEFDHSQLPWKLSYDEVDYVVSGTFTLQSGGKTFTCQAGDVMYIPKGTSVVFGSPAQARVFYVTYPVNWADLQP